jgi:predicted amidohydrolase YtcJ
MRAIVLLIAALAAASGALAQVPDLILTNGKVVTLDATSTVAEALAVEDGVISFVGSSANALKLAGPATQRIDLGGRTVIPGLIDSHIHAIRAGVTYSTEVSWIGAASLEEALGRIAEAAKSAPADRWIIVAGGWTEQQFEERRRPSQEEIMAAAPGRAVYVQLSYRAALLTPEAFAKLGIKADGDVPPKGKLEKDATGKDTGWIVGDGPTIIALFDRLPRPGLEAAMKGTRAFFRELNRVGLTGVSDPGGHNLPQEDYTALFALQREARLTLRVAYSLFAPRPGHELEDFQALTRFLPMGMRSDDGLLIFNGIGECVTWGLYNNDAPTDEQKEAYYQVALWAARRGLTLTQHWGPNASVHHLLEVFERVNREVPLAPLRWSIAHIHDARPETLARMKALGLGWLMQNGLYLAAPSFLQQRGPEILSRIPPIASALALGLPVGGGTDAHRVMVYNPFVSLQWMLDGRTVDGIATRGPGETPTREQALRLYSQGSAWFSFDEGRRGALEPGKVADLAVLTQDFLTVPVAEIHRTESLLTLVGGRVVYGAGPYAGLDGEGGSK